MSGPPGPYDQLTQVLQCERDALLAGHLSEAQKLGLKKLALLDQIGAPREADVADTRRLRADLMRNQSLISAAIAGVKKALARAQEIAAVSSSLNTYDAKGRNVSVLAAQHGALSKRS